MNGRRITLVAALLLAAILCGCAGYFHYHPVTSTEQEKAGAFGTKLFQAEPVTAVTPVISAAPVPEESLIK